MPRPTELLASAPTAEGLLTLHRIGRDAFLIQIAGRVLMNSAARRSEEALAVLGCAGLRDRSGPRVGQGRRPEAGGWRPEAGGLRSPSGAGAEPDLAGSSLTSPASSVGGPGRSPTRVLIAGLGMGLTLRAALDALPAGAEVVVAELNPVVVAWCQGPLAELNRAALADGRVRLVVGDVARVISESAPGHFDSIILDLYEGPRAATQAPDDPFYGPGALRRARTALRPGGLLAIWSEEPDAAFEKRFAASGFTVRTERLAGGGGGWRHVVYLGRRG